MISVQFIGISRFGVGAFEFCHAGMMRTGLALEQVSEKH